MREAIDFVAKRQWDAIQRDAISHWTVYDHPRDLPDVFVARRFEVVRGNVEPIATTDVITSPSLEDLRACLSHAGLVALARMEGDDPKIIEVWI